MVCVLKKVFLLITLISLLIMSSCSVPKLVGSKDKKIITEKAEECVKAIMQQDAEKLVDMFCPFIVENERDRMIKQIEQAFKYIDGNVVSYEVQFPIGNEREKSSAGKGVIYYYCTSVYYVTTDTNKEYRVSIGNHYIWDKHQEYIGISGLTISEKNSGEKVKICDYEFPTNDI